MKGKMTMGRMIMRYLGTFMTLCLYGLILMAAASGFRQREEKLERAENRIAVVEQDRDNAADMAEQWKKAYDALMLDYADMRDANITLARMLEEDAEELERLRAETGEAKPADKPAWNDAGTFQVYHYCPCALCCGKSDGVTRTGTSAAEGRTVAVDPDVIPLGSEVLLNGQVYIAEDTGVRGRALDVFVASHEKAKQMGTYRAGVKWRN